MTITTLIESLERNAHLYPRRPAIVHDGRTTTFEQLLHQSERLADGIRQLNLERGIVCVFTPTRPELAVSYYGSWYSGATVVPINYSFKPGEVETVLKNCAPEVLIVHTQLLSGIAKLDPTLLRRIPHKYVFGEDGARAGVAGFLPFTHLLSKKHRAPMPRREGGIIFHTSGTTGKPKGVMHTLESASCFAQGYRLLFRGEDNPVTVIARNCYHSGGFYNLTGALSCGTTCVLRDRLQGFNAEDYLEALKEYRATQIFLNVAMLNAILRARNLSAGCFEHTAFISAGADEVKPAHHDRIAVYTSLPLIARYSSTEATAVTVNDSKDPVVRRHRIGRPMGHIEFRIGESGHEMEGELQLRGKNIFQGYFSNPAESQLVLSQDGWYRTGDLVRVGGEGNLIFLGRTRGLIKVSGKFVYPEEIEAVANLYPEFEETVAVAVPDDIDVQVPFLFARLAGNGRAFSRDKFMAYLKDRIADYKIPVDVEIVDAFPVTSGGKIDRKTLGDQAARFRQLRHQDVA